MPVNTQRRSSYNANADHMFHFLHIGYWLWRRPEQTATNVLRDLQDTCCVCYQGFSQEREVMSKCSSYFKWSN